MNVSGRLQRRLFVEGVGFEERGASALGHAPSRVDVPVTGLRSGRPDAEGEETIVRSHVRLGEARRGGERLVVGDEVIRGNHEQRNVAEAPLEEDRGESDARRGVPPDGFDDDVFAWDPRADLALDRVELRRYGHDEDLLGRTQRASRSQVSAIMLPPPVRSMSCLGRSRRLIGQNLWPKPPAKITASKTAPFLPPPPPEGDAVTV